MSGISFEYSLQIPLQKTMDLVKNCRKWDHSSYGDFIDLYQLKKKPCIDKSIDEIKNFFRSCRYYLGDVNFEICSKNNDLIINGKVEIQESFAAYESCFELWENLSEYTRDFQIDINLNNNQNDEDDQYTKVIFRKKDGELKFFYINRQNQVIQDGVDGFVDLDI